VDAKEIACVLAAKPGTTVVATSCDVELCDVPRILLNCWWRSASFSKTHSDDGRAEESEEDAADDEEVEEKEEEERIEDDDDDDDDDDNEDEEEEKEDGEDEEDEEDEEDACGEEATGLRLTLHLGDDFLAFFEGGTSSPTYGHQHTQHSTRTYSTHISAVITYIRPPAHTAQHTDVQHTHNRGRML
jgi:hypothetical protein